MGVSHFRVRPGHSFPWVLPVSRRALGGVLQSVPPAHPKMFRKESVWGGLESNRFDKFSEEDYLRRAF